MPPVALSSSATPDDRLQESKQELHNTKEKVRAQQRRIRKLQRRMNGLATRISKTQSDIVAAEERLDKLGAADPDHAGPRLPPAGQARRAQP